MASLIHLLPCSAVSGRACPSTTILPQLVRYKPERFITTTKTINDASVYLSKNRLVHQICFPGNHTHPIMLPRIRAIGELQPDRLSPLETVIDLYKCINMRELKKLKELIAKDCCFEDYSFIKPLKGKQEVVRFFEQLMDCMGKNVKFVIKNVCQDGSTVALTWHISWKDKCIPLTKGCSFYECSEQENKLVIKRAIIVIEPAIKPGSLVLALFKLVVYIFDEFPSASEKILEKPHIVEEFLSRVYKIFLEPLLQPVLKWYINLWKFVVRIVGYMINILLHISRLLLKKQ
ncbi:hypothetical protein Scep_014643 [Stephania cephalantha]|uniref:SnoaL-like domain-containing protein n=1 Tax=Stephania cephalantha TaxID=152367 RepID=A0AAP0NZL3_9MAGN